MRPPRVGSRLEARFTAKIYTATLTAEGKITMEISLPESVQRVLQAKADEGHYDTLEEYVCALLSREAQQDPQATDNELDRFHDNLRRLGLLRRAVRPRLCERTTSRLNRSR